MPTTPVVTQSHNESPCCQIKMASGPLYISVMLFAMSTWIAIVGVWVEMPLLVNALPEAWNLPSYLVIIIQCANLGPASYAVWDKMRQKRQQAGVEQQLHNYHQQQQQRSCADAEVIIALIIILTAAVSMLLLALFWKQTAVIGSADHSVALLTLVCFAALSCCSSSVVFLPYMARLPSVYISAYYFGQGLCGLVPGLLGLAQGAGHEPECRNETIINGSEVSTLTPGYIAYYSPPRFPVSAFFAIICLLLCVSATAFCCLNFAKKCQHEIRPPLPDNRETGSCVEETSKTALDPEAPETHLVDNPEPSEGLAVQNGIVIQTPTVGLHVHRYMSLLITVGVISALWNGILPATQTYTCLPYGNIVYKLAICLSWVVSPLASLSNLIIPTSSLPLIVGLGGFGCILSAVHLLLAAQSPHPMLQGTVIGQVVVVTTSVVMSFCFSFARVSVSSVLHREGGRSQLLCCGAVTQLGSFFGALASFILVSVVKVFHRLPPCAL